MGQTIVPVILCGGSGARLWPESRESHPKQFLALMDDFSLLQNTIRRALRITGSAAQNLVTVTLGAMAYQVKAQLGEVDAQATKHILCEPSARNTAAAVAYAATYIEKQFGGDAFMWVLPSDHHIGRDEILQSALENGLQMARKGYLVTFGITPSHPETGYGYIQFGEAVIPGARIAKAFVEKPNEETARRYVESKEYLWNSGMFLFQVSTVLDHYRVHAPRILDGVLAAVRSGKVDATIYREIASQPFDVAIMEKSPCVAVVPCDPVWSDIGSWRSLWELKEKDLNGNATQGHAVCYDTRNCYIKSSSRLVACAGLDDIVVVETADSVLVTRNGNSDALKILVKGLKDNGRKEVTHIPEEPWSTTKTLPGAQPYATQEITLSPGEETEFPAHESDRLFWTVLEGQGDVKIEQKRSRLVSGQTIFIPAGVPYSIANMGKSELTLLEVRRSENVLRAAHRKKEAA